MAPKKKATDDAEKGLLPKDQPKSDAAPPKPAKAAPPDLKMVAMCVGIGAAVWFVPTPEGLTDRAWHLFALFLATIVGIITSPVPLGAVALMGLLASMLTGVLDYSEAFGSMAAKIPWLIALAYFLSKALNVCGLGDRIAYMVVAQFGASSLGLGYALVFADLIISPATPSTAARGGIVMPLAKSISAACGSQPAAVDGTHEKLGAYLILTCYHACCISSALFITANAASPLIVDLTASSVGVEIGWLEWAAAAALPGTISTLLTPYVIYKIYPPSITETPHAPKQAQEKLAALGPLSKDEMICMVGLSITIALWICGSFFGINLVAAALIGLTIMLLGNVITWKQCLAEGAAWDTLIWFGALLAMAGKLKELGFIAWFSNGLGGFFSSLGLSWPLTLLFLTLIYHYAHYIFASASAHVSAMYTGVLVVLVSAGTPPKLAALVIGFSSSLFGGLTHYGIGAAPGYFATGYVPMNDWWRLGFILSTMQLVIWGTVGPFWWKFLGIY